MFSNMHHESHQATNEKRGSGQHTPIASLDNRPPELLNYNPIEDVVPVEPQASVSSPSSMVLLGGMTMNDSYINGTLLLPQRSSFVYTDPSIRAPAGIASHMPQPHANYVPQNCGCNGTTGPCPVHIELIHAQVSANIASTQRQNHSRPAIQPSLPRSRYAHSMYTVPSIQYLGRPSNYTS